MRRVHQDGEAREGFMRREGRIFSYPIMCHHLSCSLPSLAADPGHLLRSATAVRITEPVLESCSGVWNDPVEWSSQKLVGRLSWA